MGCRGSNPTYSARRRLHVQHIFSVNITLHLSSTRKFESQKCFESHKTSGLKVSRNENTQAFEELAGALPLMSTQDGTLPLIHLNTEPGLQGAFGSIRQHPLSE